jgi:hypothetical protein
MSDKSAFFVTGAIGLILIIVFCVICLPFAVIWGLNTLFPLLAIPYTFWTWLSVIVLNGTINSSINLGKLFQVNK